MHMPAFPDRSQLRRVDTRTILQVLRRCANSSPLVKQALRRFFPLGVQTWYAQHNVYLVSYPKCGRTWLRLLMISALRRQFGLQNVPHTLELPELTKGAPDLPRIIVTHGGSPHLATPDQIATNPQSYKNSKVVLLVRDPRDAIVSLYFHMKYRCHADVGCLREFILERKGGIDTLIEFFNQWETNRSIPKAFLLVRYEHLHTRPMKELRRLFDFLGVTNMDEGSLRYAIEESSFTKMRKLERSDALGCDKLRPGDVDVVDSYKTRRGHVGGFVDYLSGSEIKELETRINIGLADSFGVYKYCCC